MVKASGGNLLSRFAKENYPILCFIAALEAGQIFVTRKVVADIMTERSVTREIYDTHLKVGEEKIADLKLQIIELKEQVRKQWEKNGDLRDRVSVLERKK